MKPYSYDVQLHQDVAEKRPAAASGAWIAQPEIAAAVGEIIGTAATGAVVFLSFSAIISPFAVRANPPWQVVDVFLIAGAVTGFVLLLKSLAMARPLLFWLEVLSNRDFNQDGVIGEPEEETNWRVLPSAQEGILAHQNAIKLWHYTYNQRRWASEEGRQLKGKPWARRTACEAIPSITEENWADVIDIWVAGGLLPDRNTNQIAAVHYRQGLRMIDDGMTTLGFVRVNDSWLRK